MNSTWEVQLAGEPAPRVILSNEIEVIKGALWFRGLDDTYDCVVFVIAAGQWVWVRGLP
jgi:hypothetical protein